MALQERQGQPRIDGLHPEAHLADLHGQRVRVHAVDAAPDDIAEGALVIVRRGRASGADAGHAVGEPACRGEQEVAGAARGVDDGKVQQRFDGTLGIGVDGAVDDRV